MSIPVQTDCSCSTHHRVEPLRTRTLPEVIWTRKAVTETHVESSNGGAGLLGLHHLRQGPHLLQTGGNRVGVWEILGPDQDGPQSTSTVSATKTGIIIQSTWRSRCWSATVRSDSQSESSLFVSWRQREEQDVKTAALAPPGGESGHSSANH